MIARTNEFKEEIKKLGREIDFKIALHTNDKITTEDNKFLLTENNIQLVVEQLDTEEIDQLITAEDIFNATISRKGNLLSTMMKEFDFEISQDLRVGDVVDCSFGLKVGNDYEYINYGKFIIFSKEHNEDTDSYSYVAYDSMLLSMKDVDDFTLIQGVTVQQAIENICEKIGLTVNITDEDIESLPNLEKVINENTFSNLEITYRDVLDNICQCLGITMISNNKNLYLKILNRNSVDTFDEEYLKNINVKFGEKYGPINSVTLSRSDDTDIIYRKDDASIELNGLCEFKIKDNPIMLYDDREDYIDEIFEQLNGVEFYVNDFSSPGIAYLESLDFYNITVGDNTYKCLLLNDEIKVQQGLEEDIFTEKPEETKSDYKTSSKTDKEVSFIVDKQKGEINAKVSQDDIIASLNVAVEDGQGIVNLVGNSVTIDSDYFKLDENGNIEATSGTFGGTINTNEDLTVGNNAYIGQNQSTSSLDRKYLYFSDDSYIQRTRLPQGSEMIGIFGQSVNLQVPNGNSSLSLSESSLNYSGEKSRISAGDYSAYISYSETDDNSSTVWVDDAARLLSQNSSQNSYFYVKPNSINASRQITISSDIRKKKNIKDINVDWIDELKIKEFEYKDSDGKQIGLIAQDYVDKDYSKYFLDQDSEGYYSITYGNITNGLIQYCQELKQEINELKQEIKSLKGDDI